MSLDSGQPNKSYNLETELPSDYLQGPGHPCRLKGRVEGPVKQKEDKIPSKSSVTSSEASQTDRQDRTGLGSPDAAALWPGGTAGKRAQLRGSKGS